MSLAIKHQPSLMGSISYILVF